MKNWVLAATRPLVLTMVFCGTNVLTSCGNSDNSTTPDTTALTEWQAGETVSAEAVEAYGGIDINTLYNPYIKTLSDGTLLIQPATGEPYCDRSWDFPYKIDHNDLCFKLFTEAGFDWGGDWTNRKDYQHFEVVE
jgi:hypothetical protein